MADGVAGGRFVKSRDETRAGTSRNQEIDPSRGVSERLHGNAGTVGKYLAMPRKRTALLCATLLLSAPLLATTGASRTPRSPATRH